MSRVSPEKMPESVPSKSDSKWYVCHPNWRGQPHSASTEKNPGPGLTQRPESCATGGRKEQGPSPTPRKTVFRWHLGRRPAITAECSLCSGLYRYVGTAPTAIYHTPLTTAGQNGQGRSRPSEKRVLRCPSPGRCRLSPAASEAGLEVTARRSPRTTCPSCPLAKY